jgi:3'-phosphoadenosine 5'-phosphosulfate sulfotransferase (PAPS reductase)/FAD synthetase
MKCISISGGRSSAMMLKIMQDNGLIDDKTVIVFANTGKESLATLDFIQECSTRWGLVIHWLEYLPIAPFFKVVDYHACSKKGEPFESLIVRKGYLPNPVKRVCTAELKIKVIKRFIRSLGHKGLIPMYLGLRYDEPTRVAKKKESNSKGKESEYYYCPLYDLRITIKDRDAFWASQPFDLSISSHYDNCDLCFMKGIGTLVNQIRLNPESINWWKQMESIVKNTRKKSDGTFYKNRSYSDLEKLALNQSYLFKDVPSTQSITCSCHD